MKYKIFLPFLFLSLSCFSQNSFDVRKANWGMTIQEIISSEYPLQPKVEDSEVEYYNVDIGNSLTATLSYKFSNGRLIKLKYTVYGYNSQYTRGTCNYIVPLYDKIKYSSFIFDALKSKNYKCQIGWYLPYKYKSLATLSKDKIDAWNCSLEKTVIKTINEMAQTEEAGQVSVNLSNDRSSASFYFNEYQNYKLNFSSQLETRDCNADFYNIYFWLEITPTYSVKKDANRNNF